MPSAEDLKQWTRLQQSAGTDVTAKLVEEMPRLPTDLRKRFPSIEQEYEPAMKRWFNSLLIALRGGQG